MSVAVEDVVTDGRMMGLVTMGWVVGRTMTLAECELVELELDSAECTDEGAVAGVVVVTAGRVVVGDGVADGVVVAAAVVVVHEPYNVE